MSIDELVAGFKLIRGSEESQAHSKSKPKNKKCGSGDIVHITSGVNFTSDGRMYSNFEMGLNNLQSQLDEHMFEKYGDNIFSDEWGNM